MDAPYIPLLECEHLSKRYTKNGYFALYDLNLTLVRGRVVGLLGPNGSGKSTLIKLITGLLVPTEGSVRVNGVTVTADSTETRERIAYLPERIALDKSRSVAQYLTFFRDFYPNFNAGRALDMLSRLCIDPGMKLKTMSKGTLEKVQLILTMARDADLYLLDEPIAGVDPAARDYILGTIFSCASPFSTILLSTHLIYDIEPILTDAIFLRQGQIMIAGDANAIRNDKGKSLDMLFREVFRC